MIFWKRKKPMCCVRCGQPEVEWPRAITQEFYDEHACPSGSGHFYTHDRWVAARVISNA